jgi:hypothetical protein
MQVTAHSQTVEYGQPSPLGAKTKPFSFSCKSLAVIC